MFVGVCNNVFRRIFIGLNIMGVRYLNSLCRTFSESELFRFIFVIKNISINEMKGINRIVFSFL